MRVPESGTQGLQLFHGVVQRCPLGRRQVPALFRGFGVVEDGPHTRQYINIDMDFIAEVFLEPGIRSAGPVGRRRRCRILWETAPGGQPLWAAGTRAVSARSVVVCQSQDGAPRPVWPRWEAGVVGAGR